MAVEFSRMMEIIGFCENLTRENETVSSRIDNNVVDEEIGYWSLLRGIIPGIISYIKLLQHNVGSVLSGTLWCGVNDIAESYSSLGYNQQLDRSVGRQKDVHVVLTQSYVRCCRVHDFCPHKIKPFSSKSGLFNASPWTK